MKVKSIITEIIILILVIVIISVIAINVKEALTKTELEKLDNVTDIAGTLDDAIVIDDKEALGEEEKISLEKGAIAVIDIPSVGVRGQVVEGTSDAVLKTYIGKFKESAAPGQSGNFCVAAHNNIHTELFRDLHKVKQNEEIRVITRDKEYIYLVKSVNKIAPTQIEVLESNPNLHEITLITCTDMAKNRIVVKGDLISTKDIN